MKLGISHYNHKSIADAGFEAGSSSQNFPQKSSNSAIYTRFSTNSTADTFKNCAKCGKGFKLGTNEAYNIKIKIRLGGISKIFSR